MNSIFEVALREYLEIVKTKFFIISLLLTPVIMGVMIVVMGYMSESSMNSEEPTQQVVFLDRTGNLESRIQTEVEKHNERRPAQRFEATIRTADEDGIDDVVDTLKDDVKNGTYAVFIDIGAEVIEGKGKSYYYADADGIDDLKNSRRTRGILQNAVNEVRLENHEITTEEFESLTQSLDFVTMDVEDDEEFGGGQIARMVTPGFFVMMLFLGIFISSQSMLTSVIEEKNTRVIEVLLSAMTPFQLMAGKVLGLVSLGLTVIFVWCGGAFIAAVIAGLGNYVDLSDLHIFLLYFLLGFFLISSMYAAIGAACNTIQEAQSLMTPLMLLVMTPMFLVAPIINSPNGTIATVGSMFPLTSFLVMPIRMAADPDISRLQIWGSLAILTASVPAVMWIASRIFRIGILMYGKPPSIRELARWVRQT